MQRPLPSACLSIAIAASVTIGCARKSPSDSGSAGYCEVTHEITVPSRRGVIFPAECRPTFGEEMLESVRGFWTPTAEIVGHLESEMRAALEHWKNAPAEANAYTAGNLRAATFLTCEISGILERLDEYHRQYVGLIDADGRQLVLVNSFLVDPPHAGSLSRRWEHRWVVVDDGGNRYWRVLYDVEDGRLMSLDTNGYAGGPSKPCLSPPAPRGPAG